MLLVPGDPAAIGPAGGRAVAEHEGRDGAKAELEGDRAHGLVIRASSGTVAVSIGATASPGTMPKRTSTKINTTSATHSGPRASWRSWKWLEGGPQKICLATRSTYTAVRNVLATAGKSHQRWAERQAPRNVMSSATKPAVVGRPSGGGPPIG